jgi:hypothetical protein
MHNEKGLTFTPTKDTTALLFEKLPGGMGSSLGSREGAAETDAAGQ